MHGLRSSRPERADFRPEKADFRPKRADFRPERAWGGERINKRTNERTKVPCVLQDFVPFGAAAQKQVIPAKPLFCKKYQFQDIGIGFSQKQHITYHLLKQNFIELALAI